MKRSTWLLAHRGWSAKYPENTLLAMTKAMELAVDGLEFDVQLTKDGVPIVIHDSTVDRTTDGTGRVDRLTFAQIRLLNAAKRFKDRPDVGWQSIPTLQEVLNDAHRLCPNGFFNIEVKVYNDNWRELVDTAVSVAAKHPVGNRVVFSSFYHPAMAYLKAKHPHAEIGLLFENRSEKPWKTALDMKAYSANLDYRYATPDLIAACHDYGLRVSLWTVDDPAAIKESIRYGADIVISNTPDIAKKARNAIYDLFRNSLSE